MLSSDCEGSGDGGAKLQTRTWSHSELLNLRVFLVLQTQEQSKNVGCGQGCFRCLWSQLDQKTKAIFCNEWMWRKWNYSDDPRLRAVLHAGSLAQPYGALTVRAAVSLLPISLGQGHIYAHDPFATVGGGESVKSCWGQAWWY